MLTQFLLFIRFLRDRKTRSTVRLLSSFLKSRPNWKREIQSRSARFRCDEQYKVSTFINLVLSELTTLNVQDRHVRVFKIISAELISNAFRHGCTGRNRDRVVITVMFSPWFIRIDVSDPGTGFKLADVKEAAAGERPHGLQVVKNLSYRVESNKKGNSITALFAIDPLLEIKATPRKYKGKSILYIKVENASAWSHMESNWEPLRHAIEQYPQKRVLIDCSAVVWSTVVSYKAHQLTSTLRELRRRSFAFLLSSDIINSFSLRMLEEQNIKIVPAEGENADESAMEWLLAQTAES